MANVHMLLARLKKRDFVLLVVTKKPDVGATARSGTREKRDELAGARGVAVDDILTCYRDDKGRLRLPQTASRTVEARIGRVPEFIFDLSYMIGDRWRDIDAGASAGCKTIWIDRTGLSCIVPLWLWVE